MIGKDLPDWLNVSRETEEKLRAFAEMVRHWTGRINLISAASLETLWTRHVLDSAQLFPLVAERPGAWADLGSGGGFPGIVIAILSQDRATPRSITLVESDQRKSAFLRKASQDLALQVTVEAKRSEVLGPLRADVVSARALAPLPSLLPMIHRHIAPTGCAVLPKGAKAEQEVALARKTWSFDLRSVPSRTDPSAQVLLIENLIHA